MLLHPFPFSPICFMVSFCSFKNSQPLESHVFWFWKNVFSFSWLWRGTLICRLNKSQSKQNNWQFYFYYLIIFNELVLIPKEFRNSWLSVPHQDNTESKSAMFFSESKFSEDTDLQVGLVQEFESIKLVRLKILVCVKGTTNILLEYKEELFICLLICLKNRAIFKLIWFCFTGTTNKAHSKTRSYFLLKPRVEVPLNLVT